MYAPSPFLFDDVQTAVSLIDDIVMGTLIVSENGDMTGSPLPFMAEVAEDGSLKLISHMDRNNPLWRQLESGKDVMVVFWGPNAHISPSVYTTTPRVPTWIYATVHITGKPRLVEGADATSKIVTDLSKYMEKPESSWDISQVEDYKARLLSAIVGFEVEVSSSLSQIRLGQLNNAADKAAVYEALTKGSPGEKQVAEFMDKMGYAA